MHTRQSFIRACTAARGLPSSQLCSLCSIPSISGCVLWQHKAQSSGHGGALRLQPLCGLQGVTVQVRQSSSDEVTWTPCVQRASKAEQHDGAIGVHNGGLQLYPLRLEPKQGLHETTLEWPACHFAPSKVAEFAETM